MYSYLMPLLLSTTSAFVLRGEDFSLPTELSLPVELIPGLEIRGPGFSLGSGSNDTQQIRDLESVPGNEVRSTALLCVLLTCS